MKFSLTEVLHKSTSLMSVVAATAVLSPDASIQQFGQILVLLTGLLGGGAVAGSSVKTVKKQIKGS